MTSAKLSNYLDLKGVTSEGNKERTFRNCKPINNRRRILIIIIIVIRSMFIMAIIMFILITITIMLRIIIRLEKDDRMHC